MDVLYHTAVGDDEGRLEAAVTAARQRRSCWYAPAAWAPPTTI
ncbi:MAG: hypothetical protein ACLS43_03565 [Evtepia gabavorous]